MTVDALAARVEELEQRARRFKLATIGIEGWENYFQSLIMQERDFFLALMAETVAWLQRDVRDEMKAAIDQPCRCASGVLLHPTPVMLAATWSRSTGVRSLRARTIPAHVQVAAGSLWRVKVNAAATAPRAGEDRRVR
jgi:hypothetical protein